MDARELSRSGGRQDVVLITWAGYSEDDATVQELLAKAGLTPRYQPKHKERTPEDLSLMVADCVAAIVSTDPFDRSVFERAPRLKVLARSGVGTDDIDLEAASEAGVIVTTAPEIAGDVAAEHTLALLLAATRRIAENDRALRRGEWDRGGRLTPWQLTGKTVGIVGMGRVGRAVAARLHAFGVNLLVSDPDRSTVSGFDAVDLDTLLERSDVVSLHLPLAAETHQLIGRRELRLMGPEAILINAARGALVDESALLKALRAGQLRAAALDVFEAEPPSARLFEGLDNVVLSPHIASFSSESLHLMTMAAVRSVVDVLCGRIPSKVANPEALQHPQNASLRELRGSADAATPEECRVDADSPL
jgi:phosphoglycerate dehydrogenase-like enzyme